MRPNAEDLTALGDLADAGKLTVPVAEVFALADAAKAFELSQTGHVRGKIAHRGQHRLSAGPLETWTDREPVDRPSSA